MGSSQSITITPSTPIPNTGSDPDQLITQAGIATFVSYISPTCSGTTCPIKNSSVILQTPDRLGTPATLQDLITLVGSSNLSYDAYVNITGTITGHDCNDVHALSIVGGYGTGTSDTTAPVIIAQSPAAPNAANVAINLCTVTGNVNVGSTCWLKFYTSSLPLTYVTLTTNCSGSGCGCANQGNVTVSMTIRYEIHVNFMPYCSQSLNLGNSFCFNTLSAYLGKFAANSVIDSAMANYCSTKYPNGTLDMFNTQNMPNANDYQICPCNMPVATYAQFTQAISTQFPGANLTQLHPPCLVPACKQSIFQNSSLQNCPGPQCINVVNFANNSVSGAVNVNQSADCTSIGLGTAGTTGATGSINPGSTGSTGAINPTGSTGSTGPISTSIIASTSTTTILIIVGVIILIVIILVIIYYRSKDPD